ncbi:MAG: hypothetical protein ABDH37_00655 [Candidatus Hydrothermales bacterium]
MKVLLFLFLIFLNSCISIYLNTNSQFLDLKGINDEIRLLNCETLKNFSQGYTFGAGFYKKDKGFIRLNFQQNRFSSPNNLNKFYFQTWILDGGANLLKSKIFGFYPIVGIGGSFQELNLDEVGKKNYSNYIYPVIKAGIEFNVNLTRERPGIFTFYLGVDGIYTSGYFLDSPDLTDFIISNPLSGFNIFFGISMGYSTED